MKKMYVLGLLVICAFILTGCGWTKTSQIQNEEQANEGQEREIIAIMHTNKGIIKIQLFEKDAPVTVQNFVTLSESSFYNETKFHRVIEGFMIQGGDPNSKDDNWDDDGYGGPGYTFDDEINQHRLVRGSLAMANAGKRPDGSGTNGSQFFIVTANATPHLDGKHTNFGQVLEGMEVVDEIERVEVNRNHHPIEDMIIEKIEIIYP